MDTPNVKCVIESHESPNEKWTRATEQLTPISATLVSATPAIAVSAERWERIREALETIKTRNLPHSNFNDGDDVVKWMQKVARAALAEMEVPE